MILYTTYLTVQGGSAEIELKEGERIKLSVDQRWKECGDKSTIYVDYDNIINTLSIGDLVYIDDGLISVQVTEKGVDYLLTG